MQMNFSDWGHRICRGITNIGPKIHANNFISLARVVYKSFRTFVGITPILLTSLLDFMLLVRYNVAH